MQFGNCRQYFFATTATSPKSIAIKKALTQARAFLGIIKLQLNRFGVSVGSGAEAYLDVAPRGARVGTDAVGRFYQFFRLLLLNAGDVDVQIG